MTIRNRLALRFMLLASLIMGVVLLVVYSMSGRYRIEEFKSRLFDRGNQTARLLLQVDEVDEQVLSRIEEHSPVSVPFLAIRIFDPRNNEIYSSGTWGRGAVSADLLRQVRSWEDAEEIGKDGEAIGFPFSHGDERFVVLAAGHDRFGRSKMRNLGRVMLVTYAVGVLITFIVGRMYARRALAPLNGLVKEVGAIHADDLLRRVDVGTGKDEIAQLACSFNELLERLHRSFNSQRNFIANASHELRTPLTVISGQLEVLLLMDRSTEEYKAAVASVLDDMRSMNLLANRLLLLAQADNTVSSTSSVPVRIDEVIWQARAELLRNNKYHGVDVSMSEVNDERFMEVQGNENLLRSLIINLLENGCKYSGDHRVELALDVRGKDIVLTFSDRGIGIPEAEREKVFSPFFRGSNTSGFRGHGIGLSLVQRIVELHKGSISFSDREGGGTIFTARLPHLGHR